MTTDENIDGNTAAEKKLKPLNTDMDAKRWAREFMEIVVKSGKPIDEDWVLCWFANAIMCGYDNQRWKYEKEIDRLEAENKRLKEVELPEAIYVLDQNTRALNAEKEKVKKLRHALEVIAWGDSKDNSERKIAQDILKATEEK